MIHFFKEMNNINRLIKKISWRTETDKSRKEALMYIDGKIYNGYTHYDCEQKYLKQNNINDDYMDDNTPYAFAYIDDKNNIFIANNDLHNVNLNNVINILKQKYPNSNIYESSFDDLEDNEYLNKKIAWRLSTNKNRKEALMYINGELYNDLSHSKCIKKYLKNHNCNNMINELNNAKMSYCYIDNKDNILIANDLFHNISSFQPIIELIHKKYPNSNIYFDSIQNIGDVNELNKIASINNVIKHRLIKLNDSCNVAPSNITFPDDWTYYYNDPITHKQYNSTIDRTYLYEQDLDYPEYTLIESELKNGGNN